MPQRAPDRIEKGCCLRLRLSSRAPVVCNGFVVDGHTHRQLDRRLGDHPFINAGSVGCPYEGRADAYWALLGRDVSLRRTLYDVTDAAEQLSDPTSTRCCARA